MTEPPQLGGCSGAPEAPASDGPPGTTRPRLTLVTLDGWALASAEPERATIALFDPGKPLALIAYLSCSPGRTARRKHLVALLWANQEPNAAHHAFRQTLWYIRQRIDADVQ